MLALAGFGLEPEHEITVARGEVGLEGKVASLADGVVERVPAPQIDVPAVALEVLELEAPVESRAEWMRIDPVVDVGRFVERHADGVEELHQRSAEHHPVAIA